MGRRGVRLQTDGEPAVLALQQAIAEARKGDTVQRNSPDYNPQSNGGAQKAVQDVTDFMQRMLLSFEAEVRKRFDLSLPWARWLVRHAAFVLMRYQVGHDCRAYGSGFIRGPESTSSPLSLARPSA